MVRPAHRFRVLAHALAVSAALTAAFVASACGGGSGVRSPVARAEPAEAPVDPGLELAMRLPAGASRCTVARVGMLSSAERAMIVRLAQTERMAWLPNAPIAAAATADVTSRGGRRVQVTLARTTAPPDEVRAWFDAHAGLRVLWEEGEPHLALRASFDDDRTLRIERGRFGTARRPGVEVRCRELAREMPGAVEISARRGGVDFLDDFPQIPRSVESTLVADEHKVILTRRALVRSDDDDFDIFDLPSFASATGTIPLPAIADDHERVREGPVVVTRTRFLWDDLALALEDERRVDAGRAADQRASQARPASEVDVTSLSIVDDQRRRWRLEMESQSGEARTAAAQELATLLARAIDAHPTEADLRFDLFDVLDRVLGDGVAAVRVMERALAENVGDEARVRMLRRAGLARARSNELAEALVEDHVLGASEARAASADLFTLVEAGVRYEFGESVWIAGRALARRADPARARRVAPVTLPLDALVDALAVLLESADDSGGIWVALEGEPRPWGAVRFDAEVAPVVELTLAGRKRLVGAATLGGDPHLAVLGRALADSVGPGRVKLALFVVPYDGSESHPTTWGRIEGTLADDQITVERVAGPLERLDWDRLARYVALPLSQVGARTFPPPDVVIEAASTGDAEAFVALADADENVRCRRSGLRLTCVGVSDVPNAIRDLLVSFATAALSADAAAITR